ncbi:hypothetical protein P3W45_001295 [Vairimorpha bombi]
MALYFTYNLLYKKNISRIKCKCTSCKSLPSDRNFFGKIMVIFLWAVVSILVKNVLVIKIEIKKDFDPLEILGIDLNTSAKAVKKKLVKLMVKYDINKAPEDKKEEFEAQRIKISKAYNIVKNKEKFARWLNNESKSGEIIAIPDVIMKNATLAFIVYCIILGMCLPNYAYRKWKNMKNKNSLNVYFDTMEVFINFLNEELKKKCDIRSLIMILSKSRELGCHKFRSDCSKIKSHIEHNYGFPLPDMKYLNDGFLVLNDHLFRSDICKQSDLEYVRSKSLLLIEALKFIAIAKGYVDILKKLFTLQGMITQAVFDEEYYLLQYPYIKFNDLFMMKINNEKFEIEDTLKKLLNGRELEEALLINSKIRRVKIEEFIAVIKNTGNSNEEASDVEDDNPDDYVVDEDKSKSISVFKISKNSSVTIRVKLGFINKNIKKESVHSYKIREPLLCSWGVFITIDNVLHREISFFNEENLKDIIFSFDAPENKNSSEIKLHVLNGQYLKNNIEDSIILKYF